MDFMGIGPLEILLVLIIGFLLLGPDKLPGMAAKAGRLYRNFKKATFDLSKTITEDLPIENKAKDIKKTIVNSLLSETKTENAKGTTVAQGVEEKPDTQNSQEITPPTKADDKLNG